MFFPILDICEIKIIKISRNINDVFFVWVLNINMNVLFEMYFLEIIQVNIHCVILGKFILDRIVFAKNNLFILHAKCLRCPKFKHSQLEKHIS